MTDRRAHAAALPAVFALPAAALTVFLLLPLLALVAMGGGPWAWFEGLLHPSVGPALSLSLLTTTLSLAVTVLCGAPLAWLLARGRGRAVRALEVALQLPVVMPPAVAGLALLLAYGRRGLLGAHLPDALALGFTTGAVVAAEIFVSAPFFVQAALSAFRALDPELLRAARSLGAGPVRLFVRVAVPLSARALLAGAAMAWARALGELGATLMFAGNLPGVTQTAPLAIYTSLESDLRAAQSMALVLVAAAFALLLAVRALGAKAALGDEPRAGQGGEADA